MIEKYIPWRTVRKVYYNFRRYFFSKSLPDVDAFIVNHTVEELDKLFRQHHFDINQFSYYYYGEDLNVYRASYDPSHEKYEWQTHVRGFKLPNGRTALTAHYEYDPTEHPELHIKGIEQDDTTGMAILSNVLTLENIQYTKENLKDLNV